MQKQGLAASLVRLARDGQSAHTGEFTSQFTDSSPASGGASIPRLVEALREACSTPQQVLGAIGGLLPLLEVSPSRRIQALLLLNPSFDRPSYPGLANRVGRCKPYVHNVCTGKLSSGPLRKDVAAALCVRARDIWSPASHTSTLEQS